MPKAPVTAWPWALKGQGAMARRGQGGEWMNSQWAADFFRYFIHSDMSQWKVRDKAF